jgi:hypothetical protein
VKDFLMSKQENVTLVWPFVRQLNSVRFVLSVCSGVGFMDAGEADPVSVRTHAN